MVQTISDFVGGKTEIGGVGRLRGIIQKQGVGFPEMEKKWFGGPQHLNPHMDRIGFYRMRVQQVLGLSAPKEKIVCI